MPNWDWLWCAEIEKFPSAVMAARHPDSVNLGDVTADDFMQRASSFGQIDVLAGGPPCQDFSVAGLRVGMAGDRGNLSLRFLEIAHAIRPRNLLVENVPGWLSMPDNAFGCFLAGLVGADDALIPCVKPMAGRSNAGWTWRKAGLVWRVIDGGDGIPVVIDNPKDYEPHEVEHVYLDARHVPKWPSVGMVAGPRGRAAWRVFDAQYFGVAQRRQRVFVVVDFGKGADPAQVLFERRGMFGNTPPSREASKEASRTTASGASSGSGEELAATLSARHSYDRCDGSEPIVAMRLNAGAMQRLDPTFETLIPTNRCDFDDADLAHTLKGEGFDASEDGTGRGTPLVPMFGIDYENNASDNEEAMGPLLSGSRSGGGRPLPAIAIQAGALRENPNSGPDGIGVQSDIAYTVEARAEVQAVQQNWSVRRLTPVECARLQGFPDEYLDITFRGKPAADGNKYKALGNSWAVPNGRWIMERIERFMP
jgi:DNA (cytosine-5)-methyltransferase 1